MQSRYTDSVLITRYGLWNIRVYADAPGQETIVLSIGKLDPTTVALVRIHSECITGETFGSLQCDCGEQLDRSLDQVNKSGNGMVIYLRQEGRGIGLFEKIQSYRLQKQGHDTYEANLLLGHRADERTYEKARVALDDLGVNRIRLLTNNPSKVSAIERLGIQVTERVPLVIPSNKHNVKYLTTKRDKFKHSFD
ncbi:MAG: GTP cyclohydrolase II [Nitrososphaera sp.]|nr:GTP cyclohydrolase II [Nitrososphaera sp.]